jgi:hypothetical protein
MEGTIFKEINDLKISEFYKDGLKGCYYDFLKRGVGFRKIYDLEFVMVMTKNLKQIHFNVIENLETKTLLSIKPTADLIKIYREKMV